VIARTSLSTYRRVLFPSVFAAASLAICIGCGPQKQIVKDRAIASGTVTFDGKALQGGTLRFLSQDGTVNASAMIAEGGKYSTDRASVGKNKVSVDTESLKFGNAAAYVAIPTKYTSPNTSGIEVELKPGENENVDFALTVQPK
jgi:hypothetical protein